MAPSGPYQPDPIKPTRQKRAGPTRENTLNSNRSMAVLIVNQNNNNNLKKIKKIKEKVGFCYFSVLLPVYPRLASFPFPLSSPPIRFQLLKDEKSSILVFFSLSSKTLIPPLVLFALFSLSLFSFFLSFLCLL